MVSSDGGGRGRGTEEGDRINTCRSKELVALVVRGGGGGRGMPRTPRWHFKLNHLVSDTN